jgi:hypothetical protein
MYSAYVAVEDYDDDFCLICQGKRVEEGTKSQTFMGKTKAEAFANLLSVLEATDYNQMFFVNEKVGDGYGHVIWVRGELLKMLADSSSGKIPENLHWYGNWDVLFVIEKVKVNSVGKNNKKIKVSSDTLLNCPFCGSPAEHESTVTQEIVRCTFCPANISYDGSGAGVKSMWNGRVTGQGCV